MANLREILDQAASELEHERNLRGKTKAKCGRCKGTGDEVPGHSDSDSHGSFWVSGVTCRYCRMGTIEVPCSGTVEAKAIEVEIKRLKAQLAKARKRAKGGELWNM